MKKLLLLGGVILLVMGGLAAFIATFDVDRYRPMVVSRLEETLGKPVQLQRMSLGWQGALAVQLQGLGMYEDAAREQPLVEMESAGVLVRLLPLLRKKLEVSSVILTRPHVHVARDAQGRINLMGLAALAGPAASSGQTTTVHGSPVSFHIASLRVEEGKLHWVDEMTQPATTAKVQALSLTVRDISPNAPMDVRLSGAIDVQAPNLQVKGSVQLAGRATMPNRAADSGSASTGLPLSFAITSLQLQQGTVLWTNAAAQPPIDVALQSLTVTVKNLSPRQPADIEVTGALAGEAPNLRLTGRVTLADATTAGSAEHVTLAVERVSLERLLPATRPHAPQLRGILTATLQGQASALDFAQWSGSIVGSGRLTLKEPVIANVNILREVFSRISMLPGLVQRLQERLPPEYQWKLAANDTVLEPIEIPVRIEAGRLWCDDLQVTSDTFGLRGSGSISVEGAVNVRTVLRIDPTLSLAIVRSVNELQALVNRDGEMELPVSIQGQGSQIAVLPDLSYVASKVLVTSAVDLLSDLLKKQDDTEQGNSPDQPPSRDSLGGFLRDVLQ